MKKQLYLNFIYSKWILLMGGIMIVINLVVTLGNAYMNLQPLIQFLNLLNIIIMVYTLSSMQNIHTMVTKNDSYHFLYALPIQKADILKADYIYHSLMLVFTAVIFSSSVMISQDYHLYYGLVMLVGISLIMMSLYNIMFAQTWVQNIYIKIVFYAIPIGIMYMFHVMPLNNYFIYDLDLGTGWEFYLFVMPFIAAGAGIIVYITSYYYARRQIIRSDII